MAGWMSGSCASLLVPMCFFRTVGPPLRSLTAVDQSVVELCVCPVGIVRALELDRADASRLAVGAEAHRHLAKRANGGREKLLNVPRFIQKDNGGSNATSQERGGIRTSRCFCVLAIAELIVKPCCCQGHRGTPVGSSCR